MPQHDKVANVPEVGDSTDDEPEIGVVSHALLAAGAANRVASRRLVLVGDSNPVTSPGMEDTQADQESDVGQVYGEDEPVVELHVEPDETESVERSEVDEDWAENATIVEDDVDAPVGVFEVKEAFRSLDMVDVGNILEQRAAVMKTVPTFL